MRDKSKSIVWGPSLEEAVTLDDVLIYLGKYIEQHGYSWNRKPVIESESEFGRFQKYLSCMMMFFCLFVAFIYFTQAFLTVLPTEYWCKLPHAEGISTEKLKNLMIPSVTVVPYEGHHLSYSRCWIYDVPVETVLSAEQPDENWPVKKCNNWDFKLSPNDVTYLSIAAEEKWVCDDAYKSNLAQSIFFMGSIVGGLVFGALADAYGRVPILVATNMAGFIGGISTIYASKFWHFCACRFVVGLAYDNCFVIAYILVLEYVGPRWRTFAANMSYAIFYTLGGVSVPWIAYGLADWKMFSIVTSVPLAFVVVAPLIIPESIRWYVGTGQIEKAVRILVNIEKVNRVTLPQDVYDSFLNDCVKTAESIASESYGLMDLFRTKRLRRTTILLTVTWGVIQMSYDGHIRCLNNLGMNMFVTFTIASATEFPAEMLLIYLLDVLGRRWSLFGSVILAGLFSLCAASVSIGVAYATLAICSRLFISVSSNIAMQYAAELLPTVVRGEGVSLIHVTGYITSILSPFIAFSSNLMYNLPMIILGVSSVLAGTLCLFLPETLMEQLPQTIMDGELFGIDQTFWDTPFTRKAPIEPRGHHLHAQRPVRSSSIMRSSMISGIKGIEKRHNTVASRANRVSPRNT